MNLFSIQGIAKGLLTQYGSPLYVYHAPTILKQIKDIKDAIKYQDFQLAYSCKANTNLKILSIMKQNGIALDTVSPGEIFLALKAGYSPSQIMYTANCSTDDDL